MGIACWWNRPLRCQPGQRQRVINDRSSWRSGHGGCTVGLVTHLATLKNARRLVILVVFSLPTILSADHLPNSQLARGKDELILAGIEIYRTPLDTIFHKLGKPTERRQLSPATKETVGERLYKWKRPDISIELGTQFSDEPIFKGHLRETPASIEVKGADGSVGHTGRGLKLGDSYTAIQKLYGSRYVEKGRRVTIQWETTTTLEVGWNERGIVDDIALFGPE